MSNPEHIEDEQHEQNTTDFLPKGYMDQALRHAETCKFHFKTLQDVADLDVFFQSYFKGKEKVLMGIKALLLNAVEHGILDIGYDAKAVFLETGELKKEIVKRERAFLESQNPKGGDIIVSEKEDGTYIIVNDPGSGFNWRSYLKIDPIRAGTKHGRGIALANALSFDKLSYNKEGNQAIAFISREQELTW